MSSKPPSKPAATPAATVSQLLERYKAQIAAALPRHLTPDRMARLALTSIRGNQRLAEADALSLMGAIIRCSQDGLEPGRTAHLVPFRETRTGRTLVQYIPDYRGLIELARRSGEIDVLYAEVVYRGDRFEFARGTEEYLRHEPRGMGGQITHAYAVARYIRSGAYQFSVMPIEEVEKIKRRSRAAEDGPWQTDYEAMVRKTVARQLCKWLPQSPELQRAVLADELADDGRQALENRAIIDGEIVEAVDLGNAPETSPPEPESNAGVAGTRSRMRRQKGRRGADPKPAATETPETKERGASANGRSDPGAAVPGFEDVAVMISEIDNLEAADEVRAVLNDVELEEEQRAALRAAFEARVRAVVAA